MTPAAVQLYSLRNGYATDPIPTLRRLRDAGFDAVELYDVAASRYRHAAAMAATGIVARSGHERLIGDRDLHAVFTTARDLGLTTVIEPAVTQRWSSVGSVRALAEEFNKIAALAAAEELIIGYHNHWWEFEDLDGRTALELFAEHLDPVVVIEVDVYWAAAAGVDPGSLVARLGPRVRLLHLKDGPMPGVGAPQVPLGRGAIDVAAVSNAAPDAQAVLEFDEYDGDLIEALSASADFLHSVQAHA